MRKPILTTLLAVTLCTFLGCSDENYGSSSPAGKLPLLLSGQILHENITRANDFGFAGGDRMGIYVVDRVNGEAGTLGASDNRANNVLFTYDGDSYSWTSPTTIYWRDQQTPVDIYGYYPGVNYIENPTAYLFSVQTDQSTEAGNGEPSGYEQSDLLWGKAANVGYTQEQIVVKYHHILAGVRVQLQKGEGISDVEWQKLEKIVLLANTKPQATVDLSQGTVTSLNSTALIRMAPQSNDAYRAVVIPQQVAANKPLVSITLDGQTYSHSLTSVMNYEAGKLHNFTLTVNKREASGDYQIALAYDGITPWVNDESSHAFSTNAYVIVHCPEPGKLKESIRAAGYDPETLQSLKVTGFLNGDDFNWFRNVKNLNLKDVRIKQAMISYVIEEANNTIWDGDPYLADDVLPQGLKNNSNLRTLVLPSTLKGISAASLTYLNLMNTTLEIPEGVTHIGDRALYRSSGFGVTLILPNSLDSIGWEAFYDCTYNCDLNLSENISYIGKGAFCSTENFYGVFHVPAKLKTLNKDMFGRCGRGFVYLDQLDDGLLTGTIDIPQGITEIPQGCFGYLSLKNRINLTIPQGVKKIGLGAFCGLRFSSLSFPDDLVQLGDASGDGNIQDIKGSADGPFRYASIPFQLNLPKHLMFIAENTFERCGIEGELTIPESCVFVGEGCFTDNHINKVTLSSQMESVSNRTFKKNDQLKQVLLPKYIDRIGDEAFAECEAIQTIISLNPEPPALGNDVFRGVYYDKCILQVPVQSVESYRHAEGWKQFQNITPYQELAVNITEVTTLDKGMRREGIIRADGAWEVTDCPAWCSVEPMSGDGKAEVTITVNPQSKSSPTREGRIAFSLKGKDYTIYVPVKQLNYEYGEDETIVLQKASAGASRAVPLFIVGEGYNAKDIQSGKYLTEVREQMEYLFSCEPFKTYRNYFTVSTAIAVSPESGIPSFFGSPAYGKTRFNSEIWSGEFRGDNQQVWNYACEHGEAINNGRESETTIMVLMNSNALAAMTYNEKSGRSISYVGKSTDAYPYDQRDYVLREVGGTGFGKLAPEHISHFSFIKACICDLCNAIDDYNDGRDRGWYSNVSLSCKMTEIPWSHLIYFPQYSQYVDIYEGAYRHARGVYRSEEQSVMSTYIPYFNTISRESIVKRILQYAGETYSFDKFVAKDKREYPAE